MDSTLKTNLNAIQPKAVPTGNAAVTDPIHYLDPAEFNTVVDAVKANNTDIEAAQSDISTLQSAVSTLQSNPVSSKGPRVVSTDPINGATNVLSDKVITVTVDQFLYPQSVNTTNIQLKDKDGNIVPITISYTEFTKVITINHASNLTIPASPYALHISTGVLNTVGEPINNNAEYILGFNCGTDNFPTKPAISYDNVTKDSARINLVTPSTDDLGSVSYVLAYGDGTVIADPVTLPYTFSNLLNPGTQYTVKLGAKDSGGQITWSDPVSFTTTVPVVTGLSVTPGFAQNNVSWNAGVAGATYNLYWSTTPGVTKANGTKIAGVTSPYTHSPLTNGTTYYYVVTQVVNGNESADSAQVSGLPRSAFLDPSFESGAFVGAWGVDETTGWAYIGHVPTIISPTGAQTPTNGAKAVKLYATGTGDTSAIGQSILRSSGRLDYLADFGLDLQIISAESTAKATIPYNNNLTTYIRLELTVVDSGAANLISTAQGTGLDKLYLWGFITGDNSMLTDFAWDTWQTKSKDLKAYIISILNAGKSWTDVDKVTLKLRAGNYGAATSNIAVLVDNFR